MTSSAVRTPQKQTLHDALIDHAQVLSISLFFILCCVLFAVMSPYFLLPGNLLNLIRQLAPLLVVAVGMTFVITTGGIDLSVGSTAAMANAVVAIELERGLPWPISVLVVLVLGALVGTVLGWFVAYQKIPSFIVTLAGLSILRGVALLLTQGYSIPIDEPGTGPFIFLGRGWIFGFPVPALFAVLIAVAGFIALTRMRYGRHVIAVGANMEAARRVGIPSLRIILSVFMLSGLSAAFAGLLIAARLGLFQCRRGLRA
jgi:simple sugar transport system permease protein